MCLISLRIFLILQNLKTFQDKQVSQSLLLLKLHLNFEVLKVFFCSLLFLLNHQNVPLTKEQLSQHLPKWYEYVKRTKILE